MNIKLGISPCPNDTFAFDALLHNKVSNNQFNVDCVMADVENLNKMAFNNEVDICKVSFNAYLKLSKDWILLNSGSALGFGCGPLVISKKNISPDQINDCKIAIPGINTTANLLFSLAFPNATNKQEVIFSDIESAVLSGDFDIGVIIHESRFTYKEKGLNCIIDLGKYWEKKTNSAIPLGGIIARRSLHEEVIKDFDDILRRSILFARENPESSREFIKANAQETDDDVIQQHINLYVNDYSVTLEETGRKAITTLFTEALNAGLICEIPERIFI